MNWRNGVWACGITVVSLACTPKAAPPEAVAPIAIPSPPAITDEAGPYMLRYFQPTTGALTAVRTRADVPEGARGQVIVSPEDPNLAGTWLYVADLTEKRGGAYTVRSVERAELESQVAKAHPVPAVQPTEKPKESAIGSAAVAAAQAGQAARAGDGDVVIFRTTWCGYCKKTAEYLRLKGVKFVEKDLENDAGAREDMLSRARRAGVAESQLQGVPILSVRGHIIVGFNRGAIDAALKG